MDISLDDDQRFKLLKFKRNVSDILKPQHDNDFLIRWLRARNWNPEEAEKMLRKSFEWRKTWNVDEIHEWPVPDVVEKYHPSGLSGFDKLGAPVIILPFAHLDVYGMLRAASKSDLIRITVLYLERYVKLAQNKKVAVIIDLDGFTLRQYMYKPVSELIISLLQMYEQNYPEILGYCFIINAPKMFAFAFSIVKNFLHEYTLSKIQIIKNDPKKWKPLLLARIDADQLPKHYGGTMLDPDGDPKCPSKIKPGGKVPKSLYKNKLDDDRLDGQFQTVEVKKGDKFEIDYDVDDDGCTLQWNFKLDENDIKFGIVATGVDGKTKQTVAMQRVSPIKTIESGFIACEKRTKYTVIFDNTYSYFKSKKINYFIHVSAPIAQLTENLKIAVCATD